MHDEGCRMRIRLPPCFDWVAELNGQHDAKVWALSLPMGLTGLKFNQGNTHLPVIPRSTIPCALIRLTICLHSPQVWVMGLVLAPDLGCASLTIVVCPPGLPPSPSISASPLFRHVSSSAPAYPTLFQRIIYCLLFILTISNFYLTTHDFISFPPIPTLIF